MLTTEAVDRLSIPFGLVIGPATVASNTIKLVSDVTQMLFYGLLSLNVNTKHVKYFHNYRENLEGYVNSAAEKNIMIKDYCDRVMTQDYKKMDASSRYYINYYSAKYAGAQHVRFIGIGIIRTVPILGGLYRTYSK